MVIPEEIKSKVKQQLTAYCEEKVPGQTRDQIKLSFAIRGNNVTIYESRPHYIHPQVWTKLAIAQFRYADDKQWTLYCVDRNNHWNEYFDTNPTNNLQELLDEVDDDPTGIFWG